MHWMPHGTGLAYQELRFLPLLLFHASISLNYTARIFSNPSCRLKSQNEQAQEFLPIPTKNLFYTSDNDNGVEKFKDDAVYQAELSAKTDLEAPLRFDIPSGPVIYDDRRAEGKWGDDLYTYVYVYQDERLGVSVEIEYPQYSLYAYEVFDYLHRPKELF